MRFLRRALTGEKVTERYDTFEVQGFRLGLVPEIPPTILVAALRPAHADAGGRGGRRRIVNWLSAADVAQIAPYVGGKEIVARIFVAPTDDFDVVRTMAARAITSYLNVDVYAKFHEWLGRGPVLQPMWDAWAAGDRARALELVPDEVIDDLIVWGTPAADPRAGRGLRRATASPPRRRRSWDAATRCATRSAPSRRRA